MISFKKSDLGFTIKKLFLKFIIVICGILNTDKFLFTTFFYYISTNCSIK